MRGGGGGGDIGGESPPAYTCLRELRLASARTFTCAVSRHSFSHLSNSIPLQQCLTLSFFRNSHKLCFSSILHLYELWAWDVQRSIFKYIRKWMNDSKLIKQMSPFLYDKHSQCDTLQDLHTCFSDIQNLCWHSFSHIFDILSFLPDPCNSFTQKRSLLEFLITFFCIKPKLTFKNFHDWRRTFFTYSIF